MPHLELLKELEQRCQEFGETESARYLDDFEFTPAEGRKGMNLNDAVLVCFKE